MPAAGELIVNCWHHAKQTAYRGAWFRARNVEHWGQFVLARAEAQRVYIAARESQNERTRNTMKLSTCSHKWWETLKCSIFGVESIITVSGEPECGLVVVPAEKTSLLGFQVDSNSVVSSLSLLCFVSVSSARCNSLAFRISVLLRLLLNLDTYMGVDPLGVFLNF